MIVYHGATVKIENPYIKFSKKYLDFGSVADDDVFKSIDMYFKGIWDEKRTLAEIRYYKMNNQICLISQKLINNELRFVESYEVR